MRHLYRFFFILIFLTAFNADSIDRGRWTRLFPGNEFPEISCVGGAGNYIWFSKDGRTIGRMNVLTKECRYFDLDSLGVGSFSKFAAAGDSSYAVIFSGGADSEPYFLIYNGTEWKQIPALVDHCHNVFKNRDNSFWVSTDYSIYLCNRDDVQETIYTVPDKVTIFSSIAEDSAGIVWCKASGKLYKSVNGGLSPVEYPDSLNIGSCLSGGKGEVFFLTPKGVYTCINDTFSPVMPLDSMGFSRIDTYNNLWCFGIVDENDDISSFSRVSLETHEIVDYGRNTGGGAIVTLDSGAVVFQGSGYKYYPIDGSGFEYFSFRDVELNNCGNLKYGEPFLWNAENRVVVDAGNGGCLLQLNDGVCSELPFLDFNPSPVLDMHDGRMLTTTTNGLYTFDGTKWEPFPDSKDIRLYGTAVETSQGDIWGYGPDGIFHWNGTEWKLFLRDDPGIPGGVPEQILVDSSGMIWTSWSAGSPGSNYIAGTRDGETWEVFDTSNAPFIYLMERQPSIDPDGHISLWICDGSDDSYGYRCPQAVKLQYDAATWKRVDTVSFASDTFFFSNIYEDSRKDIWVEDFGMKMLRYSGDTIIQYHPDEVPAGHIVSEDRHGNLYAYTREGYYKFSPVSNSRIKHCSDEIDTDRTLFSFILKRRGNISIDFNLSKDGKVEIALFSLKGTLIKRLYYRKFSKGRHLLSAIVAIPQTVTILKVQTPDGSHAEKIFIR